MPVHIAYLAGLLGVLVIVIGYAVRTAIRKRSRAEQHGSPPQQSSEVQAIPWTDPLTGLANRRFLDHALGRAWRAEMQARRSMAVLMIDIDHFNALNEQYGHPAGDACLREVAGVLQRNLVRPDDVLARYGGQEFIAVLLGVDLAGAHVVGERLRLAVRELHYENAGSPLGIVTISVGVSCAILDGETVPERLVEQAERALYDAKCAGRDRTHVLIG